MTGEIVDVHMVTKSGQGRRKFRDILGKQSARHGIPDNSYLRRVSHDFQTRLAIATHAY